MTATDDRTRFDLDERQRAMLHAMGIRVWSAPAAPPQAFSPPVPEPAPAASPSAVTAVRTNAAAPALAAAPESSSMRSDVSALDWLGLQEAVRTCRACGLCEGRRQTVFGTGSPAADRAQAPRVRWLVVGEAPGEQEDATGEPFVGAAGQLLDNMLRAVGLSRNSSDGAGVYIANTLKCRPPGNRNPQPAELAQCLPFLRRQIELLQPQLILALGRFAAQAVLQHVPEIDQLPLGRLRGRVHRWGEIPVVVSYHPAYLLRSPAEKAKTWEDLVLALQS